MIKASDFEPPCSVVSERTKPVIPVLRSLPVWVQSQQEAQVQQRETIPSHLEGNRPVSPVNPWRTNQWNHMQLSQHTSELSGVNQGGNILAQGIIMQYAGILNGWCLFVFLEGSLRCGCITVNIYHISVIHAAGSEQTKLGCMLLCFMFKYINKCAACYFHCGFSHYQEQDFFHEPTTISPVIHCQFFCLFFSRCKAGYSSHKSLTFREKCLQMENMLIFHQAALKSESDMYFALSCSTLRSNS